MRDPELRQHIRRILESERIWCAYALADLDPAEAERCTWLTNEESVVLIYKGFDPAVLFAHGEPDTLHHLFNQVPSDHYLYTLKEPSRKMLDPRLEPTFEARMWRMNLDQSRFPSRSTAGVERLGPDDLAAIQHLYGNYPDRPDAFHERQLAMGPFFGIRENGEIISIAGVHIVSPWASVAAIGNVFTRPDRRGQGLATKTSAAVVQAVLEDGIDTIVLNVAMDNEPALRCYENLGFTAFCNYYEGSGYFNLAELS
ncbi:MAG TPA: GNAT family N-acetyltransferase [Anaerolineae bacterium]|nr:GNAT family N-acetyltransferase [Anaerolineae bacterium]